MEDSALIFFHTSESLNTTDIHLLGVSGVSKNWGKYEKFKNTNLVVTIHPKLMKIKKSLHKNIRIDGKKNIVQFVVDGRPHNDYF